MAMLHPKLIVLLSGKRKSGKDFISDQLRQILGAHRTVIVRISAPLKCAYANEHNLDYLRLLESDQYKEVHRLAMVAWGESKRCEDPGYFCRLAIEQHCQNNAYDTWIVSDCRRKTDLEYFKQNYSQTSTIRTVRIEVDDEVRLARNWVFTKGIDDAETECDLDRNVEWDAIIKNNEEWNNILKCQLSNIFNDV